MARARNIKPGLFKNELLGVADPLLTILFASLWCLADKEGRLEDRPLRIKAETFPYRDNLDVNGYLTQLSRLGFIRRYEVDAKQYIQVLEFKKHQTPHHTEKGSVIPPMTENYQEESYGCDLTENSPLKERESPKAKRSDSLIPDSLNTDSGFTDSLIGDQKADAPKAKRKTRLPADFLLTDERRQSAVKLWGDINRLDLNPDTEFDKFVTITRRMATPSWTGMLVGALGTATHPSSTVRHWWR